jgi:hypothetical protein
VEAEKTLRAGIELLESLRPKLSDANKVAIFETQTATYQLLQKVLIAQNKPEAALEISERGRARAFVELLASRLSINNNNEAKPPQSSTIAEMKQIAKTQNSTLVQYSIIRHRPNLIMRYPKSLTRRFISNPLNYPQFSQNPTPATPPLPAGA